MATKPIIASPVMEWDSREVAGVPTVDWASLITWPDTSGQGNDGVGGGSTRRYEERGFGGSEPDVRFEIGPQDHYDMPVGSFAGNGFTLFAVLEVIDISSHLAIIGSDGGASPGPRFIDTHVQSDGAIVFNRSLDTYDVQSAPGVIVEGTKYVITARYSVTTGMIIRVNAVQVGANAGAQATQIAWLNPSLGVTDDQITGGVGRIFGEKRFAWAAGYQTAASDSQITEMEGFLADLFTVPGVGLPVTTKPPISNPRFEYDVNTLSASVDGDTISPWPDTSGQGNDATISGGAPEYEAGAWLTDNTTDVRFSAPSAQMTYDGSGFIGTDLTLFWVLRTFDLSTTLCLMGGSSFGNFQMLEIFVRTNGAIVFSFGTNEGATLAVETAAGVIVADGTCYVITFKHTNAAGKIIRLNGTEIAANPSASGNLSAYSSPRVGNIANAVFVNDEKHAWIAGYATGASPVEMAQMEAFLDETFCAAPVVVDPWVPSNEPGGSSWSPTVF